MWICSFLFYAGLFLATCVKCDNMDRNGGDFTSKFQALETILVKQGMQIELLQRERAKDRDLISKLDAKVKQQTERIADLEAMRENDQMRIERLETVVISKSLESDLPKSEFLDIKTPLEQVKNSSEENDNKTAYKTVVDYSKMTNETRIRPSGSQQPRQPAIPDVFQQTEAKHAHTGAFTKRLLVESSNKIAFSASLSKAAAGLGTEHPIPFDKTLVNYGNAFDSVVHTFFCPVNGVYVFHVTIMAQRYDHIQTELVKDGTRLFATYSAGSTSAHGYDQGSNAVITNCNQGQHVWVRVLSNTGNAVFPSEFSLFSGFLLFTT